MSTALQTDGFNALTPPNLLRGVAGDAAYVASFLARAHVGPVVLVGHSYGGVVITNAAEGGGDVKALVYVNVFIPDVGENVFTILGGSGSALDVPDPTSVLDLGGYPGAPEGDVEAFLKASTVHDSFAQDLSEADRWLIAASQRPIALGANIAPTEAAAWKIHPELGGHRHGRQGHPTQHAAFDGGTGWLDGHRGCGFPRVDGVATTGNGRRDPGRGRGHRGLDESGAANGPSAHRDFDGAQRG